MPRLKDPKGLLACGGVPRRGFCRLRAGWGGGRGRSSSIAVIAGCQQLMAWRVGESLLLSSGSVFAQGHFSVHGRIRSALSD